MIATEANWPLLQTQAQACQSNLQLRDVLQAPARFDRMALNAPYMLVDFSKNLLDDAALSGLLGLVEHSGFTARRQALLAGEVVNHTEQRPALHAVLRQRYAGNAGGDAADQAEDAVCAGLHQMLGLAQQLRASGQIQHVVHIGIGGSGLGPELLLQALQPWCDGPQVRVVSNMDGHDLHQALQGLQPATTLFVVASKSWSTAETQRNLHSAQQWFAQQGGSNWPAHFVAITARTQAAYAAGFTQVLHMPEGIGGRFSVWSAVGLPVALAVGREVFEALLQGGAAMDAHFEQAPLQRNVPVWLGMLDVWYSSLMQVPARCVAPYHHGLRRLPAYLQQLEMESNGKRVHEDGSPVHMPTTGMVWGEPGSNGQHAFFQWLHQGSQWVPVEFLAVRQPAHPFEEHHECLLANALAQAQALMQGAQAQPGQLPGHQDFPGNRPSTFILLDALTPQSLGALLAMYEHRVFVAGVLWGINSFDQWGVELGKTLATDLRERMKDQNWAGLDASTAGLLSHCYQSA